MTGNTLIGIETEGRKIVATVQKGGAVEQSVGVAGG
jgi:hypothetical protein